MVDSPLPGARFVAINTIDCLPGYTERFEHLFGTRARAIDTIPGFLDMRVLRSQDAEGRYLVVSFWESKEGFDSWVGSDAFREGHKRGFEDVRAAKEKGEQPPMVSTFHTYEIISD